MRAFLRVVVASRDDLRIKDCLYQDTLICGSGAGSVRMGHRDAGSGYASVASLFVGSGSRSVASPWQRLGVRLGQGGAMGRDGFSPVSRDRSMTAKRHALYEGVCEALLSLPQAACRKCPVSGHVLDRALT